MSDGPSAKEIRSMGAHPERTSKPSQPKKTRRPLATGREMIGPGFFDDILNLGQEASKASNSKTLVSSETDLIPRQLKFEQGTKLYMVVRDAEGNPVIPRTEEQEEELFDRALDRDTVLNIPVESLEMGERGGTIIRKFGKSKFGAFTIALIPIQKRGGETVKEERLVSFLTRSKKNR